MPGGGPVIYDLYDGIPRIMNFKKISLLILLLLVADQALKIWVKTHMHLDESIMVVPDWFQLRFIENNGAAFGMHIASRGGFDWGKLLLGVFRIVMVGFIGWLMYHLSCKRRDTPKGVIAGLALIFAGAMGNILDSALLRTDFLRIDSLYRSAFRRPLRRLYDGQGGRHVLFPAVPVERRAHACCAFWSTATTTFSAPYSTWPMPTSR